MASAEEVKHRQSPPTEPNMSGDGRPESNKSKIPENWRLSVLAQPKSPREKYQKPDETFNSGVNPGALTVEISERNEHLSRPPLRTLVMNKRQFSTLPTTFLDYLERMDKKIEYSWACMYNYYKKAKRDLSRKSSKVSTTSKPSRSSKKRKPSKSGKETTKGRGEKGKKEKDGKGKKGKVKEKESAAKSETKSTSSERSEEDIERERALWLSLRATPKVIHKPEPIDRGPIASLDEIKNRMDELATPRNVTQKFSDQPVVDIYKINEAALTYEPTDRIHELSRPPAFWSSKEEPLIPGAVKPGALQAVASPRILELSVPRETVNAKDADLKEDPFTISPNALKYIATARVVELAKPITRT